MKDRDFRLVCIVLSLGFLVAAWLLWGLDDTLSTAAFVLTLVSSGVFAVLRP